VTKTANDAGMREDAAELLVNGLDGIIGGGMTGGGGGGGGGGGFGLTPVVVIL